MGSVACLLCLLIAVAGETITLEDGELHYTNTWVVELHGVLDRQHVSEIARIHGMVNQRQVIPDSSLYEFLHPLIASKSEREAEGVTSLLLSHMQIKHVQQQVAKLRNKRMPREIAAGGVRVKRSHVPEPVVNFTDPNWGQTWHLNRGMSSSQYDMNVIPAWNKGYTGKNVVVTIVCDGLERDHPDLVANYDPAASTDINSHDDDPMPRYEYTSENRLGTRCAGEVAGAANNSHCTVGVAHNAKIGGIRMLDGGVTDSVEASSFSHNINHIDIYAVQWGPNDNGRTVDGPGPLLRRAFENGIQKGRNGKGSIYVWAAGTGGSHHDSCSCDGYTNSIYTVSVNSASESNTAPWYIEECASTIATTYSSGSSTDRKIYTTDLRKHCTNGGDGTAAAASIASGLIAVMLEANNNMTWRDVQHVIVATSNPDPLLGGGAFITNGAGRKFSHKFGFGLMDCAAMVDLAKNWRSAPPQLIYHTHVQQPAATLDSSTPYNVSVYIPECRTGDMGCIRYVEHVQLNLTVSSTKRGAISVILVSPSGTSSTLLDKRVSDFSSARFTDWPFSSIHFWGEKAAGEWMFIVDTQGYSGLLSKYSLTIYGTSIDTYSQNYTEAHNFTCHSTCDQLAGCFGSAPTQCIACRYGLFKSEDTHLCLETCSGAHYASGGLCKTCDYSCNSCNGTGPFKCTSCRNGTYLHQQGSFTYCADKCPQSYYADYEANTCSQCRDQCDTCTNASDCKDCDPGFQLINGQCKMGCKEQEYRSEDDECVRCPTTNCNNCGTFGGYCLECSQGYVLYKTTCVSSCPTNTYNSTLPGYPAANQAAQCFDCDANCKTCDGPADNNCLTCDDRHIVSLSHQCILNESCPLGQYRALAVGDCEPCHESCHSCAGPSQSECTSCNKGLFLLHGDCVDACGVGYYNYTDPGDSHKSCQLCDTSCSECYGPASNQCTTCMEDNAKLVSGVCQSACPPGAYAKSLDTVGQNETCANCSSPCRTCTGPLTYDCTSCPDEKALTPDGYCVKDCQPGYYEEQKRLNGLIDHTVCQMCHDLCATCSGSLPTDCLSCDVGYILYNGQCRKQPECHKNQYYDKSTKMCVQCNSQCQGCSAPSVDGCTSCSEGSGLFVEYDGLTGKCLKCCESESDTNCCSCN